MTTNPNHQQMERVAGIEPAYSAWKADVLPLNYTRGILRSNYSAAKTSNLTTLLRHGQFAAIRLAASRLADLIKPI